MGGSRGKMRRGGVLDEGIDLGGRYGGGDTLRHQPCGRAQRCTAPASVTPSFPHSITMTSSARGGALHRTILLEGLVIGSQGKMRRDSMLDEGMEG